MKHMIWYVVFGNLIQINTFYFKGCGLVTSRVTKNTIYLMGLRNQLYLTLLNCIMDFQKN